jgi:hypothetical protein
MYPVTPCVKCGLAPELDRDRLPTNVNFVHTGAVEEGTFDRAGWWCIACIEANQPDSVEEWIWQSSRSR